MSGRKKIITAFILFLLSASVGWHITKFFTQKKELKQSQEINVSDKTSEIVFQERDEILIFIPSDSNILIEERSIEGKTQLVVKAESIISEYLKGLDGELKKTKLLGTYIDRQNILYIDLSNDFKSRFNGDAKKEYNLLKSLFLTIKQNIPEIEDVKILIEGKEFDSIGGHFLILHGLSKLMDEKNEKR